MLQFLPLFLHTEATCPVDWYVCLTAPHLHPRTASHTQLAWCTCVCELIFLPTFDCSNCFRSLFVRGSSHQLFFPLHTVLGMPFPMALSVGPMVHTHLHLMDVNLMRGTCMHSAHSCALSQALCVKQVELLCVLVPFFFSSFLSLFVCRTRSTRQSAPSLSKGRSVNALVFNRSAHLAGRRAFITVPINSMAAQYRE